ncbi:acyltransferase domain-containing protein [Legionella maceachernii]|uniref:[acyl-carrier-protein] S-malonyltransferase n=1 Tax=Legionella maceachernii TaxID=466 RepID=A0A0W0VXC1_9GAMM|nr:acyltransferase domain-containing protein [Legionella maceachernii]KTD24666.1 putative malonyl-CoA acyl-carrier-protein transacylase [Legionella maceachernii]SKA26631.1 [acyl-carrier-protein] S-malonyltransferase [Legionella maceachernii]SUP01861.1 Malonyl CoA-acyl carrier protein transacylase [Legionella maceachernii]
MNVLCLFAGQGYQEDNLFNFFNDDPVAQEILHRYVTAMNLPKDSISTNSKNPFYAQLIIGCYQLTLFARLKPLFEGHQLNFAGYSLGEVAAFLASIEASPDEMSRVLAYRTKLMTSVINKHGTSDYDLLYINGTFDGEEMRALVTEAHCYLAIINSDQRVVVGGKVTDLKKLLIRLSHIPLKKTQFLNIHLPSHTPFYENLRGQFHQFINALGPKNLHYPIISPIKLGKVYEFEEEKEWLDQEIYTPLEWQKVCELINEYQYDRIIDLGPGNAMTQLLNNESMSLVIASEFKSITGFYEAISREFNT